MEALPANIRNLPPYAVSNLLFTCTAFALGTFMVILLTQLLLWIYRACKRIHNYDYMHDTDFLEYYKTYIDTYKLEISKYGNSDKDPMIARAEDTSQTTQNSRAAFMRYNKETSHAAFNRHESRMLEFICLSVVVAININAHNCRIINIIGFMLAILLFFLFNILRIGDIKWTRVLFFLPLVLCFISFFADSKSLNP